MRSKLIFKSPLSCMYLFPILTICCSYLCIGSQQLLHLWTVGHWPFQSVFLWNHLPWKIWQEGSQVSWCCNILAIADKAGNWLSMDISRQRMILCIQESQQVNSPTKNKEFDLKGHQASALIKWQQNLIRSFRGRHKRLITLSVVLLVKEQGHIKLSRS